MNTLKKFVADNSELGYPLKQSYALDCSKCGNAHDWPLGEVWSSKIAPDEFHLECLHGTLRWWVKL